jgi:hypothetical protein
MNNEQQLSELGKFLHEKEIQFVKRTIEETGKVPDTSKFIQYLNKNHKTHEQIKRSSYERWVTDPDAKADARNTQLLLMRWKEFEYDPGLFPALGLQLPPMLEQFIMHANDAPPERVELALRILRGETEEENFSGELARVTA